MPSNDDYDLLIVALLQYAADSEIERQNVHIDTYRDMAL